MFKMELSRLSARVGAIIHHQSLGGRKQLLVVVSHSHKRVWNVKRLYRAPTIDDHGSLDATFELTGYNYG